MLKLFSQLLLILNLVLALRSIEVYAKGPSSRQVILKKLKTYQKKSPKKNSNEYPVYSFLKALDLYNQGKIKKASEVLESVILIKNFEGTVKSSSLSFGPGGGYESWRNLIYALLSEIYYNLGKFDRTELYAFSLDPKGPLWSESYTLGVWSLIAQNKYSKALEKVESSLSKLSKSKKRKVLSEMKLQKMVIMSDKGQLNDVLKLSKEITKLPGALNSILNMVLARTHFKLYSAKFISANFKKKLKQLNLVIKYATKVKREKSSPEFDFMVSETYWFLASLYRLENPDKYKKKVKNLLGKADQRISYWVDKSIQKKKALLREEAMFFSVALLWEAERFNEAIKRLVNLPKIYPLGEYLEDSYQLLGDHYFENKKFKKALKYYRLLAKVADAQKASYGVYKAAWTYYNLGDKMASLRHFERLILHYQKLRAKGVNIEKEDKIGLVEETRRDFISVLAETLNFKRALKELKIFKFNKEQTVEYHAQMAKAYQKIGKFKDSVAMYKTLLNHLSAHQNSLNWLTELLNTHLAAGTRKLIPIDLDDYYPKLNKKNSYSSKDVKEFNKSLKKIVLTIHKEARKTNDLLIWQSIDLLYRSYFKHFPNSKDGDIWYFGAQRQERLGKKWDAVKWYQRASETEGYENSLDAGVSALSIAKDMSDQKSLVKKLTKKDLKIYSKVADATKWFFKQYPDKKQAQTAKILFLEASFFAQKNKQVEDFLKDQLQKKHKESWNYYLYYNKKLYEKKKWKDSYKIATFLLKNFDSLEKKKMNFLRNVAQETSFLTGRLYAKKKTKKSREWFLKSVVYQENMERMIKGWLNLIGLHTKKDSWDLVEKDAESFSDKIKKFKFKKKENASLVRAFYSKVSQMAEGRFLYQSSGEYALRSSYYARNKKDQSDDLYRAVTLFALGQDLKNYDLVVKKLRSQNEKFFRERSSYMSRWYFYLGGASESFQLTREYFNRLKDKGSQLLLLVDLFKWSKLNDSGLFQKIARFIKKREKKLKNKGELVSVWNDFYKKRYLDQSSQLMDQFKKNLSFDIDADKGKDANLRLKRRLTLVSQTLKSSAEARSKILKFPVAHDLISYTDSLCQSAEIYRLERKALRKLGSGVIKSSKWKVLKKNLVKKLKSVNQSFKAQIKSCRNSQYQVAGLTIQKFDEDLSCQFLSCRWPELSEKADAKVLGMKPNLTLFQKLVAKGHYLFAERVLSDLPPKRRILGNAYLRASLGDFFGAEDLLRSQKINPLATLFKSLSLAREGYFSLALSEVKKVKSSSLNKNQKNLWKKIRALLKSKKSRSLAAD